ncbi:MAG: hypothetical protein ACOC1L_00680 [Bacillota bacterium]
MELQFYLVGFFSLYSLNIIVGLSYLLYRVFKPLIFVLPVIFFGLSLLSILLAVIVQGMTWSFYAFIIGGTVFYTSLFSFVCVLILYIKDNNKTNR